MPRVGVGGGLRELRPSGCEPHTFFERQRAGGDERRHLPQRMAGERQRGLQVLLHGVPRHERRQQHGELRITRAGQLLGGSVEQQRGERLAEGGLGPVDDAP